VLDVLDSAHVVPPACVPTAVMMATPAPWIVAHQVWEETVAPTLPECAMTTVSARLTPATPPVDASSPPSPATMAMLAQMTPAAQQLVVRASQRHAATTTHAPATTATQAQAAST